MPDAYLAAHARSAAQAAGLAASIVSEALPQLCTGTERVLRQQRLPVLAQSFAMR